MELVCIIFTVVYGLLIARVLLSWIPVASDSPFAPVYSFVFGVTEPILAPVRNALPPVNFGGVGIDLSIIVVFILMAVLKAAVGC